MQTLIHLALARELSHRTSLCRKPCGCTADTVLCYLTAFIEAYQLEAVLPVEHCVAFSMRCRIQTLFDASNSRLVFDLSNLCFFSGNTLFESQAERCRWTKKIHWLPTGPKEKVL